MPNGQDISRSLVMGALLQVAGHRHKEDLKPRAQAAPFARSKADPQRPYSIPRYPMNLDARKLDGVRGPWVPTAAVPPQQRVMPDTEAPKVASSDQVKQQAKSVLQVVGKALMFVGLFVKSFFYEPLYQ